MKNSKAIDIEQLLAERPFELLTPKEKDAVLAQMPEWEYQRLYQLVTRSRAALKRSPAPNPAIREQLMAALRQQPKPQAARPTGLLVRLAQYRLPAWQAAAGLALLLVAHFGLQKQPTADVRTETVFVNTTDTIYKQMAIPVSDTVSKVAVSRVNVKPRMAKKVVPANLPTEALADSSSRHQGRFGGLPDTLPGFRLTLQHPNGRSANEMKELWQFLGDVY
ncbi:MAG: hypothetical protein K9J37_09730 [Saprospiraceae bacterium]|nr:hypothetical protein [Saprospiraceae bacterium]MCF8250183.1 hypothetical protein [Saprospiraceae bacterium]MCF8279446.1 hypothetical protein [Bacteroidales bacterium]MCF8311237.1 hypothetical protein [Saprospiraceae bacterium]MCF8440383.1 hypothetical protein [Saprospiraceae bacterium]